jgi:hypothetical protein
MRTPHKGTLWENSVVALEKRWEVLVKMRNSRQIADDSTAQRMGYLHLHGRLRVGHQPATS